MELLTLHNSHFKKHAAKCVGLPQRETQEYCLLSAQDIFFFVRQKVRCSALSVVVL